MVFSSSSAWKVTMTLVVVQATNIGMAWHQNGSLTPTWSQVADQTLGILGDLDMTPACGCCSVSDMALCSSNDSDNTMTPDNSTGHWKMLVPDQDVSSQIPVPVTMSSLVVFSEQKKIVQLESQSKKQIRNDTATKVMKSVNHEASAALVQQRPT
ncbi:hypothetical protein STEG23_011556, partial [Scotinomys teguina]